MSQADVAAPVLARRLLVAGEESRAVAAQARALGFTVVGSEPELVLCHGGDGTLLRAERDWPSVPKVPARVGARAQLCPDHGLHAILQRLRDGTLADEALGKLELVVAGARFLAMNDIVMRNESPATAVRFSLQADGLHTAEITGDGIVFATPFGSTGYYRSITRSVVESGLGIAYNNSTEPYAPLLLSGEQPVDVSVLRGPAVLVHDNDVRAIPLREGHRFTVRGTAEQAHVLGLDALRCQVCRKLDGSRFNPH
jgi:NAD+ kinase